MRRRGAGRAACAADTDVWHAGGAGTKDRSGRCHCDRRLNSIYTDNSSGFKGERRGLVHIQHRKEREGRHPRLPKADARLDASLRDAHDGDEVKLVERVRKRRIVLLRHGKVGERLASRRSRNDTQRTRNLSISFATWTARSPLVGWSTCPFLVLVTVAWCLNSR